MADLARLLARPRTALVFLALALLFAGLAVAGGVSGVEWLRFAGAWWAMFFGVSSLLSWCWALGTDSDGGSPDSPGGDRRP